VSSPTDPVDAPPPPGASSAGGLREWIAVLLGNSAVLTALLIYFGWRRNDAHATGLGMQENLLQQSTQDYLLRSVGSVVVAVLVILGSGWPRST
jgi:hypothetical protein